ncbi:MAG: GGDEF and EAL domain-containing protein [Brevundimonas sp.]|uniref:bifunctional diguanylate cyclase/phosphodiesterase n=1 Tax=Brevundimonas sp. TaxID=1871086 RepID=UPI00122412B3|nr:EAL domain-containing protein [Brevundimonas sp.]RZJ18803.1 MAG: GGDEF and EAL domain-containing protein [Brevundimonas sp.]
MRVLSCLFEQHDHLLVALAALICVVGSIVTARLYVKTRASIGRARVAWLFMGAVAGGATIWCTHFVAMLAYRPGVETSYAPAMTGASLLVAMLGCAVALWLGSARFRRAPEVGGAVFGGAVTAMHYTGMAAFTAEAFVIWSPAYVVASVLAALGGGALALRLAADTRSKRPIAWSSLALVLTIVALHFTGMGALTVLPLAPMDGSLNGQDAAALLAVGVAAVGFLILGTAVASYALEEQTQRLSRGRLNSLIEGSVDGMVVEADGVVLLANAAFLRLCDATADAVTGAPASRWIEDADTLTGGELVQTRLTPRDGVTIPVEVAVRRETGADGRVFRVLAVRDLRARLAQERRIAHLARNDSLTGLPNRASFLEKLNRMAAAGEGARFALLAIDLDRFKEVNDLYGHAVGDRLLTHVAEQMSAVLREGEFIARLGGDEFVALTPVNDRLEAMEAAERLRAAIQTPTRADHADLQCGASVGVALWPDDAREASVLINNADLAMYRAKAALATDVCFYEEAMDEAVRQRRRVTQGLREALDNDRFELHYQLQASVETGEVTGYEALLRWRQPDGTYISPVDFIPIAEDTGMILPIGEWVLRRACEEAAGWPEPHRVAVNLSPIQLSHVDLPRLVHRILLETGLKPSRLELEITESAMISDMERTTHILRQLKALGVSVAMDDFGTGYSSLSTLRAFPFDKIKLDRSFMSELDGSPQSQAIIRAVLALGESLAIPVLAEGVETQDQLDFLRSQGCNEAQGYLLGRPAREAASGVAETPPAKVRAA